MKSYITKYFNLLYWPFYAIVSDNDCVIRNIDVITSGMSAKTNLLIVMLQINSA